MTKRYVALCAAAVLAAVALQGTSAHALSMTECSAKYKAAKAAGTLNGEKWNDFRKAECGSTRGRAGRRGSGDGLCAGRSSCARTGSGGAPVAVGNAVFPSAVDPKYSKDSAGKARMRPASTSTMPTRPTTAMAA